MENYTADSPQYSENISIVQTFDVAHADNVNAPIKAMQGSIQYLKNLVDSISESVSEAGTGSESANKKLDDMNAVVEVTLAKGGWTGEASPWKQTVDVTGLTAKSVPEVFILKPPDNATAADYIEQSGYIFGGETAEGKLTMYAYIEKPTVDIRIAVKGR